MNRGNVVLAMACMMAIGAAGCQKQGAQAQASPPQTVQAAEPVKKPATAAQWHEAVNQTFDKIDLERMSKDKVYATAEAKTDDDGIQSFPACFDRETRQCKVYLSGKSDRFRKVQFFSDNMGELNEMLAKIKNPSQPMIRAYVSLRDCADPKIVLMPVFRSGGGWLFMDQVSVMVNGNVVFDRKLENTQVDRETDSPHGVREASHVFLTESEVEALRPLSSDTQANVIVRFSGQKGYVTIEKDFVKDFNRGMKSIHAAYDTLLKATHSVGQVEDSACP